MKPSGSKVANVLTLTPRGLDDSARVDQAAYVRSRFSATTTPPACRRYAPHIAEQSYQRESATYEDISGRSAWRVSLYSFTSENVGSINAG